MRSFRGEACAVGSCARGGFVSLTDSMIVGAAAADAAWFRGNAGYGV